MERDPVCDMEVDPRSAAGKSTYQGKTYYFCSPGCKRDFDKEPQRYIEPEAYEGGHNSQHMHHG